MSRLEFPGSGEVHDPELTPRQRQVFEALVGLHSRTTRAVGSESLVAQGRIGVSPASIRATLGELEEMGLLDQSHASAGRVPSPAGYRYFVRQLVRPAPLDPMLTAELDAALRRCAQDVEHLLGEASRLLSEFSHQLAVAVAPGLGGATVEGIELVPVSGRKVMLVLGLRGGIIRTLVLEMDTPLSRPQVEEVARVLRDRLIGRGIETARALLAGDAGIVRDSATRMVLRALEETMRHSMGASLYSTGASHIASQPEFVGKEDLASILRIMESGSGLDRILLEGVEGQPAVRVGVDEAEALSRCSMVSYRLPGRVGAAIGVIGPMRMNYARALALVDRVGQRLGEMM